MGFLKKILKVLAIVIAIIAIIYLGWALLSYFEVVQGSFSVFALVGMNTPAALSFFTVVSWTQALVLGVVGLVLASLVSSEGFDIIIGAVTDAVSSVVDAGFGVIDSVLDSAVSGAGSILGTLLSGPAGWIALGCGAYLLYRALTREDSTSRDEKKSLPRQESHSIPTEDLVPQRGV